MNFIQSLLQAISPLPDGDFADRLNYCYTTTALIVASAFISGWSFVGSPLQCWFPAYYKGWWIEYALDYCYVQNTYFVPFTEVKAHNAFDFGAHIVPIPKNITHREEKLIGYYQWVPFILAGQALLFYLPVVLWRALYNSSGFKVKTICDTCAISGNMEEDERKKNMLAVAGFLVYEHTIDERKRTSKSARVLGGSTVLIYYLIIKLVYAINALVQFWLLKFFLGVNSHSWGITVAKDLLAGKEWPETGNFPRVTICDFSVRVLANLHRHSVQCVLMINMFNEKIFVMLWFWLAILLAASLYSLVYWFSTSLTHGTGRQLVTTYLHKIDPSVARSLQRRSQIDEFISEELQADGLFLVRLISSNSGDLVTCELLSTLWKQFLARRRQVPPPYSEPLLVSKKDIDEHEL